MNFSPLQGQLRANPAACITMHLVMTDRFTNFPPHFAMRLQLEPLNLVLARH